MVYAVTHFTLCLIVYEWACHLRPMNRIKHADEFGINASSDVRKAVALTARLFYCFVFLVRKGSFLLTQEK